MMMMMMMKKKKREKEEDWRRSLEEEENWKHLILLVRQAANYLYFLRFHLQRRHHPSDPSQGAPPRRYGGVLIRRPVGRAAPPPPYRETWLSVPTPIRVHRPLDPLPPQPRGMRRRRRGGMRYLPSSSCFPAGKSATGLHPSAHEQGPKDAVAIAPPPLPMASKDMRGTKRSGRSPPASPQWQRLLRRTMLAVRDTAVRQRRS
mmetsp:Transcript_25874/g.47264  ORF Transcript_25874/g.47264 Transcript_25874/m.47264 type:complete len:203 (-) Transcript_25874:499-1107(-)